MWHFRFLLQGNAASINQSHTCWPLKFVPLKVSLQISERGVYWRSCRHVGSCCSHLQIWGIRTHLPFSASLMSVLRRTASLHCNWIMEQTVFLKCKPLMVVVGEGRVCMHMLLNLGGESQACAHVATLIDSDSSEKIIHLLRRVCLHFSVFLRLTGVCSFSPVGVKMFQRRPELLHFINFESVSDLQQLAVDTPHCRGEPSSAFRHFH